VFAPSAGTTEPALLAGVGLVLGRAAALLAGVGLVPGGPETALPTGVAPVLGRPETIALERLRAVDLPPAVASSAPDVTPITTNTLTATKRARLKTEVCSGPPPMISRRSRQPVSLSVPITSTIRPDDPTWWIPGLAIAR